MLAIVSAMADGWEVVTAVATVGAVGTALGIAIRDGRVRDRERADSDAAQARMVVVAVHAASGSGPGSATLQLINDSAAPIRNIDVIARLEPTGETLPVLVPRERPWDSGRFPTFVMGGQEAKRIVTFFSNGDARATAEVEFEVTFQDARGLNWSAGPDRLPVRLLDRSDDRGGVTSRRRRRRS